MNTLKKIFLATGLASALLAPSATAVPILVAYNPASPTLQVQPGDNGDGTLAAWGASMVSAYNTFYGASLPSLPAVSYKVDQGGSNPIGASFNSGTTSITLNVTGINYLLLSWGGGNGIGTGGNGNLELLYYINGYVGTWNFDNGPANGGLSSLHVYGNTPPPPGASGVPDQGSTVLMLGLGLVTMGLAIRRRV